MQFSFQEMWQHMGAAALVVASVLLVMGFASLVVFVERWLTFTRSRLASRRFLAAVKEARRRGEWSTVAKTAREFPSSFLARLVQTGIETYIQAHRHRADGGGLAPLEKTQRHMERYIEQAGIGLRRGFAVLAAVGSIAPFVGLLGTVVGIISAFQGIAETGSGGLAAVAGGISEALVETALGLTVAIPAVLAYNFLASQANAEEARLKNALGELLDEFEDSEESGRTAVWLGLEGATAAESVRAAKPNGVSAVEAGALV